MNFGLESKKVRIGERGDPWKDPVLRRKTNLTVSWTF